MRALRSALLLLLPHLCSADESIVLAPPKSNGTRLVKMLVFVPGGDVPNDRYVPTAKAIQAAVTQLDLWVVIPAVFKRLCIISCSTKALCAPLHSVVEDVLGMAAAQGWKRGDDSEDTWVAGHSLGGVCANTLFQAYSDGDRVPFAGIMEFGSYIDEAGAHDLINYPKPVLTLNGELDAGLARPGKTAIWWRQYLALEASQGAQYAVAHKPVIILPKLNHSDFCPGFDVPGDLMAEISQEEATATIGAVVGAFLDAQMGDPMQPGMPRSAPLDLLNEKVTWTRAFLAGYLKAQDMERTASDTQLSAEGASPLCVEAQHIVAGLATPDDTRLAVADSFHVKSADLEHCHPGWNATAGGLSVSTCGHADYYADFDNTGSISAASQVACKMLSSARVAQELKVSAARPSVDCKEVNRWAVDMAMSFAAPSTMERYTKKGRGWCFLDDVPVIGDIGPVWVFSSSLTMNANASCMAVASPVLKTGLDSKIYPGCHYCKLLSPARAMDWMMSDSLKPAAAAGLEELLVV